MRLLDAVSSCTTAVVVNLRGELYRLPGAGSFAGDVSACPLRYILDADIIEAAARIVGQWPDLLDPSDPRLRAPAETVWIEWRAPDPQTGEMRSAGMLVQAAINGRSGRARSFWMGEHGPEASQISLLFDLDNSSGRTIEGHRLYPVTYDNEDRLIPHFTAAVDQGWHRYFAATALGHDRIGEAVQRCADMVVCDLHLFFAFARLLNSQIPFRRREIDRSRLNTGRLRIGKPILLDHVELSLAIGDRDASDSDGVSGERGPARLHLVRGHLVRRRDAIFWRSPHLRGGARGDANPVVKTVRAHLR